MISIKHFPDIDLLEAFSMFDGKNWPEDSHLLQELGDEYLSTLTNHFSPAQMDADAAANEWEIFTKVFVCADMPSGKFHKPTAVDERSY